MVIFPGEIIEFTAESNFARHSVTTGVVYMVVTVSAFLGLALLPVIHVDVGVRGRGILTPSVERAEVRSLVSGTVEKVTVSENSRVGSGEVLAVLKADELLETIRFTEQRVSILERYLEDLDRLLSVDTLAVSDLPEMNTARYRRSLNEFELRLMNAVEEAERIGNEFLRKKALYERELISREQFDSSRQAYRQASRNKEIVADQQMNRWTEENRSAKREVERLQSDLKQHRRQLEHYTIRAPVAGTVQKLAGVHGGSIIFPQQVLAEINPDTTLVAEIYISPADVGLLREGMPVRLQIDAFDSHQWGVLSGKVLQVSNDAVFVDKTPVFIIQCTVDKTFLELANGYRGSLRKGMTLQARFLIAKRSLFQLIYDNLNDWLNPEWSGPNDTQTPD